MTRLKIILDCCRCQTVLVLFKSDESMYLSSKQEPLRHLNASFRFEAATTNEIVDHIFSSLSPHWSYSRPSRTVTCWSMIGDRRL